MKKTKILLTIILAGLFLLPANIFAQDDEPDNRPVREPFSGTLLGDQQTIMSPYKGGLELIIHHRFGTMENGLTDLYGIYAPSNIRLGLNYGVTEKLMVGFGTEKNNKFQEFSVKYKIFDQTRSGSMPVALSYYYNISIDGGLKEDDYQDFTFTHRFSFFHQLIIARKFSDRLSVQLAPSFAHFNGVGKEWHNDYIGMSAGGRFIAFGNFAVIAEYDHSFGTSIFDGLFNREESDVEMKTPKPNLLLGFEIGTPTHSFQLFAATYDKISPQKNLSSNMNDFMEGEILVGMNVLVRF